MEIDVQESIDLQTKTNLFAIWFVFITRLVVVIGWL
jgi:hypothetical protein